MDRPRAFLPRAVAVWLVLIGAEVVHGALRTALLAPRVGDLAARQIGVFTGAALILAIARLSLGWIGAGTTGALLLVGVLWLVLTLLFKVAFGRLVLEYSWERVLSDYDIPAGGLLPLGLIVMALAPLIAARLRGHPPRRR